MTVTVFSTVLDTDALSVIDYVNKHFQLSQKEIITLGFVATQKKVLSTQLSNSLQLNHSDKLKYWLGSLLENGILISRGVRKGTEYLLNPDLFSQAKLNLTHSLKTIEPHRLQALIIEDLKINGSSKISDIHKRIPEVLEADVRKQVYKMIKTGQLEPLGAKKDRVYCIPKKNK